MAVIKIQDTGYVKPTNEGTQASAENRMNSGAAITLKTFTFAPSITRNLVANPELASNIPAEVNLGSIENMQFQITCKLDRNVDADMALINDLLDAVVTNGYKLMWYQYTNATNEKNNGQLIYQIAKNSKFGDQLSNAEKTAFTIPDNFYTLHVLFNDFQPQHISTSSLITYVLKGIVLKVETSLLT